MPTAAFPAVEDDYLLTSLIMQNISILQRRLFYMLAGPLLAALGVWLFVEAVLVISRGLTHPFGGSLLLAVGVLVGFLLIAWVAAKPERGLYLFILTFPLTNESIETSFATISLTNILLVTMVFSLVVRRVLAIQKEQVANPLFGSKFFLLSWLVMATVISALVTPYSDATMRFLITRIGYALTFLIVLALVSDVYKLKKVFRLMVWSASATAVVTIIGGFFPNTFPQEFVRCNAPLLPILNTPRCAAFNLSFHSMGSWLLAGLAPVVVSIAYPKLLGISRRLATTLMMLLLGGLIIGQVRGGWVALALSLPIALAFAMRPKSRNRIVSLIYYVSVTLLAVFATYLIWDIVVQPIIALRSDTFLGRLESYQIALQYFRQHWLFGIGPLNESFPALEAMGHGVVDNLFIVEIAATGVLGAIPFLLLWFGGFRSAAKVFDFPATSELHQLAGATLLGLLWVMLSMQAYVAIGEKAPWIILGLAASLARIQATAGSRAKPHGAMALQGSVV